MDYNRTDLIIYFTIFFKIDLIIIHISKYINNKMSASIDFTLLGIPIPELIKQYPLEKQEEIYKYLSEIDEHHKQAYIIAYKHLGSSFNIYKSNGFKEWKSKK